MENIFYNGWEGLVRTLIVGVLAYAYLVLFLRWSGKRTLAEMNAFDMIVTVSIGSTLSTTLLSDRVALAEGIFAFTLLIGLQFSVTWSSIRVRWLRRVVTGEPSLLFEQGAFLSKVLRRTRVTEGEVRAAVRSAGLSDMASVAAVVLETDGSFSVLRCGDKTEESSLADVRRY